VIKIRSITSFGGEVDCLLDGSGSHIRMSRNCAFSEIVQSVDWSPTTECTLPDQEISERRPYAPQGATGSKK
jgi:hypothetical protein